MVIAMTFKQKGMVDFLLRNDCICIFFLHKEHCGSFPLHKDYFCNFPNTTTHKCLKDKSVVARQMQPKPNFHSHIASLIVTHGNDFLECEKQTKNHCIFLFQTLLRYNFLEPIRRRNTFLHIYTKAVVIGCHIDDT